MTSGRLVPFNPIVFNALLTLTLEYPQEDVNLPASTFIDKLCKAEPCGLLAKIVVAFVATPNPAEAAPDMPPKIVPDKKPELAPSITPCQPSEIPPVIAPTTAPDKAAPSMMPAVPPVNAVATANPAITPTPIATFAQLGSLNRHLRFLLKCRFQYHL